MKKETEELLGYVASCIKDDKAYKQFQDFIKQVKETEVVLTKGGYMQDSNGDLVRSGDFIMFEVDNNAPECDRGIAIAQMVFSNGRFCLVNGNWLMNINPAGVYDMADLKDAGFKFYKIQEGLGSNNDAIEVKTQEGTLLLKPEIWAEEGHPESKFVLMTDAEGNSYGTDGSDDRFEWKGSHFIK